MKISIGKKLLSIALVLVMIFSLSACKSKKTDAAQKVDDQIAALGTITLESLSALESAERAYNLLTDREKESLDNRNLLLQARNDYEALPKYVELTRENFEEYFAIENTWTDSKSTEGNFKYRYLYVTSSVELKKRVASLEDVCYTVHVVYNDDRGEKYGTHEYEDDIVVRVDAVSGKGSESFTQKVGLVAVSYFPKWNVSSFEITEVTGRVYP